MSRPWLAIDPSFRNTGWAIMDEKSVYEVGLIETAGGPGYVHLDNDRCIRILCEGLDNAIRIAVDKFRVGAIHSEAKGGSKSAKACAMMAMAQAIVASKAHQWDLDLHLILPGRAKLLGTGNRKATKDQVKRAMEARYPEASAMMRLGGITQKARQEHIFDATLVGYAVLSSWNQKT